MGLFLSGALVFDKGRFSPKDVFIDDGGSVFSPDVLPEGISISSCEFNNCIIVPGFLDVHVHLREPGFSYKETIRSGTLAAAHGGFTGVCTMPNLSPVPDCYASLREQLALIKRDALIKVKPFGSVTRGERGTELSDMEALSEYVCGFSDDGKGIENEELMSDAMLMCKRLGKVLSAHCEDTSLVNGGCIHAGEYARLHSHPGIVSESEWRPVERDIKLAAKTGCSYHVCHVSAKETVELIRQAKKAGIDVTCETAPHYLLLDDSDLIEDGRFKMNPPLRARADREALLEGLCDGTVDMIATDHAPHSREEKSRGLEKSIMGITGIELSFPLCYTHLVKKGIISLEKLVELMSTNPKKRFNFDPGGYTVFKLDEQYSVTEDFFQSMGKSTPFLGETVQGKCIMTVNERIVWDDRQKARP